MSRGRREGPLQPPGWLKQGCLTCTVNSAKSRVSHVGPNPRPAFPNPESSLGLRFHICERNASGRAWFMGLLESWRGPWPKVNMAAVFTRGKEPRGRPVSPPGWDLREDPGFGKVGGGSRCGLSSTLWESSPPPPAPGSGVRRGWARAWPLEMGKLRPGDVQSLPRASSSFPRWPETAMKHQCDPTFLLGTPARRPLSWGHPQVSSLAHACAPHGSQAGEGAGRRPSFQGAHLSGAQEEGTLHRGALSSQSPGALLGLV